MDDLPADDKVLVAVERLLQDFSGVILVGPPGTGKSWHARRIAARLVRGDAARAVFVQFHPSYQYEDFVQGFVPTADGGFVLQDKQLMQACEAASEDPSQTYVIAIDELNRCDPGRVFGEALTYIERTKRGERFILASGDERSIPQNLVFLATMNPLDRGTDEVDAAFERRFAKVAMDPDPEKLRTFLTANGMEGALISRVLRFFGVVQGLARDNPYAAVGHTYFQSAKSAEDLRLLWEHQLRFVFDKAYRLQPTGTQTIRAAWDSVFAPAEAPGGVDQALLRTER